MRVIKTVLLLAVLAIVAVGIYDGLQPTLAEKDARTAATDVAKSAAHTLFQERSDPKPFDAKSADASNAASATAKQLGVTVTSFRIDATTNTVHVTVVKEAKSIVIKHIRPLRHLDEINVSASAAPA